MVWDVIGNQWSWLGAAGFFMVTLGCLLAVGRRSIVGTARPSQEGGWSPTGRIDFSGPSESDPNAAGNFVLQAEDTRLVRSIGGIDHREIRWRKATLSEAKKVVSTYHGQLNLAGAPAAGSKSADKLPGGPEEEDNPRVEAPALSPSL